jgi:SAM-dependent methyltransferase
MPAFCESSGLDILTRRGTGPMNIREFYETFPYPPRDTAAVSSAPSLPSDFLAINHYVFGGAWARDKPLRVLAAGCGTGLAITTFAAQMATVDVPFSILCIDVSQRSLEIARTRARAAGLSDFMDFRCQPIEALEAEPAESFDYIDLSGVLNHVEDPARVLRTLYHVLADPGGFGVMVYGRLGRTGIYPIQDALRLLGLTTPDSVPAARALLGRLPDTNWLRRNPLLADYETISDAEFADRFLNPRDRAFSVRDLCALFAAAGLEPQAFVPPVVYDAKALLRDGALRRRAAELAATEQWHLAEQLQGSLHKHTFYAIKSSKPATAAIDFADPGLRAVIRGPNRRLLANAFADKAGQRVSIEFDHDSQTKTMALQFSALEIRVLALLVDGVTFGAIREKFVDDGAAAVSAAIERVCKALLAVGVLYLEVAPRGS